MPIEIKELHIRVSVNASLGTGAIAGGRGPAGTSGAADEEAKEAIVAECVEQVLRILHEKMER